MALVAEKPPTQTIERKDHPTVGPRSRIAVWAYTAAVIAGLLLLEVFDETWYAVAASVLAMSAFAVVAIKPRLRSELVHAKVDRLDLAMIALTYTAVVGLYWVAFRTIEGQDLLLFLFFALGMIVGVAGPVIYTVWGRGRTLATLGLTRANLPRVASRAVVFAAVQFSVTFWGYDGLPAAKDVITLGAMSLVVGIFESIFFRGFVQGRLQAAFGVAPALFGAALLYGIYHVGYGMGAEEIVFLSGLGIVYALAYATNENLLIMWPLLTPLGSLFAQLEGGELTGRLPWAALLGFGDVLAVMVTVLWFAHRHERRRRSSSTPISDIDRFGPRARRLTLRSLWQ